jgi:hypothetical protein
MKIFVLYRLKDGVSFDEYRRWSLDADQPTLRAFKEITHFSVYSTTPTNESTATYTVVEMIEIENPESWSAVASSAELKALGPAFERFVDTASLCILHGEEITA